jgi:adenylate cyclase
VKVGLENHWVVMGYAVNIASRLQAATKELNNNIVVSADIYDLANHVSGVKSQSVALIGVTNPLMVYTIGKPFTQKPMPQPN